MNGCEPDVEASEQEPDGEDREVLAPLLTGTGSGQIQQSPPS